jgi:hypothetical protein
MHDLKLPAIIFVSQTGKTDGKNTNAKDDEQDRDLYFDSRRVKQMKIF